MSDSSKMKFECAKSLPPTPTLCSFVVLAVIRGSFAVLIHYGIASYKTPSLLFLLRTPGTLILFLISVLYLVHKDHESKLYVLNDFKNSRTYKRAALLGFFQLCGPYMLLMYAMKFLSPTVGAVFMCATTWATALLEQFLTVKDQRENGFDKNFIGSIIGVAGMVAISVANLCLVSMDTSCEATYGYENVTSNTSNISNYSSIHIKREKILLHADTCFTSLEISTAYFALCGAALLWSISSVFSKLKHVNVHFLVGGMLNNSFGGLYAGILWLIVEQHINTNDVVWNSSRGSLSVIFLSILSSWAASLILYYLYRNIGAESTNRVMCLVPLITWLEDLLFLHHHRHMLVWMVIMEAIGLLLVVIGLYLSSFSQGKRFSSGPGAALLPGYVSEEEDEDATHRQGHEMTDTAQSEDPMESSSFLESAEPPLIHYADDDEDNEEGEIW